MHIRAHGSLFDDGCLYRLGRRGEGGGDPAQSDCSSCRVVYYLGTYLRYVVGC